MHDSDCGTQNLERVPIIFPMLPNRPCRVFSGVPEGTVCVAETQYGGRGERQSRASSCGISLPCHPIGCFVSADHGDDSQCLHLCHCDFPDHFLKTHAVFGHNARIACQALSFSLYPFLLFLPYPLSPPWGGAPLPPPLTPLPPPPLTPLQGAAATSGAVPLVASCSLSPSLTPTAAPSPSCSTSWRWRLCRRWRGCASRGR